VNKTKIFLEAAIVIIVVLALVLPGSAIVTNTNLVTKEKNSLEFINAEEIPIKVRKIGPVPQTTSLSGNVLISFGEGDYTHPQITKDGTGNIVVAFTQEFGILDHRMAWSYLLDNGNVWEGIEWTEAALDVYNDIAWENAGYYTGLFGSYNNLIDNFESFYTMTDITDTATWSFYYWTEPSEDLTYNCISDYGYLEGQYHEMDGPVWFNIQYLNVQGYDVPHCPNSQIGGFDELGELTGGESTFDGQRDIVSAPASDPDMSNEYMKSHYTWHCFNEDEQKDYIVWKMLIPVEGDTDSTDIEYTPYYGYVGEGDHPAIAHSGDNVAIVYMNGDNVMCAYSSDNGDNWNTMTIGPGSFPDITAVGGTFQCAYANQGNLFVVESDNGGISWGTPVKINEVDGSVVEEENAIDIHSAGIVWTDSRDGDYGIYFATFGNAPAKPSTPDGPSSGSPRRSYTYMTSSIDPNGDDISYGWDWNGDDTVDEWTDFFSSGETVSTSHTWTEDFTGGIKVKAKDTNDEESPWSDPLEISIPKSKAMSSSILQRLINEYPYIFQLLRQIVNYFGL